jgi:8-oxo-dGTP pyrophosphatase MutT (NUDIX family)
MTNMAEPVIDNPLSSPAAFARLARKRLRPGATDELAGGPSDFDLNPGAAVACTSYRSAAVLVPVVARDGLTLLLTRRTEDLRSHAGQIAFPGGRVDDTDRDCSAAALREAREEIGLDPALVEPLGFLPTYRTGTGFAIAPLVGLVSPAFQVEMQTAEVADVFEVPLSFLMDPENHQTHTKMWNGAQRRFYAMSWNERFIWGATAGILKTMHERLFRP